MRFDIDSVYRAFRFGMVWDKSLLGCFRLDNKESVKGLSPMCCFMAKVIEL